jgi:hypothetical protein
MATPLRTDPDEQFIAMRAWLLADLLRLLDHLRTTQSAALGAAIRDDLDYHAGLLRLRLRHTAQRHDKDHP